MVLGGSTCKPPETLAVDEASKVFLILDAETQTFTELPKLNSRLA